MKFTIPENYVFLELSFHRHQNFCIIVLHWRHCFSSQWLFAYFLVFLTWISSVRWWLMFATRKLQKMVSSSSNLYIFIICCNRRWWARGSLFLVTSLILTLNVMFRESKSNVAPQIQCFAINDTLIGSLLFQFYLRFICQLSDRKLTILFSLFIGQSVSLFSFSLFYRELERWQPVLHSTKSLVHP